MAAVIYCGDILGVMLTIEASLVHNAGWPTVRVAFCFIFNSPYCVRPYLDHGKYKHGFSATTARQCGSAAAHRRSAPSFPSPPLRTVRVAEDFGYPPLHDRCDSL